MLPHLISQLKDKFELKSFGKLPISLSFAVLQLLMLLQSAVGRSIQIPLVVTKRNLHEHQMTSTTFVKLRVALRESANKREMDEE